MALNKLIVKEGTGLTSCLSVRLDAVVNYRYKTGYWPDAVDSNNQFRHYQDRPGQVVCDALLSRYSKDENLQPSPFNHGYQYGWLDDIELKKIAPIGKHICSPSAAVLNKATEFRSRVGDRTAIIYRGNDKGLEIIRTPYTAMEEMARDSGAEKFIVQTDEQEFYEWFKARFPDTICFNEIPRISKNPDSYVMPEIGSRVKFAVNFFAVLIAVSSASQLIMNTGNISLWAAIFRGRIDGIYQWHGNENKWKKYDRT